MSLPGNLPDDYGVSDGEWLKIDWRENLARVELESSLGRTPVDYVEMGEGPPILLVHGLGGSWRNWLENIPFLARRHRVLALDLPGFGTSPAPVGPITITAFGAVVNDFANRLDLAPDTALVGHSMGGFIASDAVIHQPGRFSSLTLVSAAGVSFAGLSPTSKSLREVLLRIGLLIASRQLDYCLAHKRLRTASFAGVIAHPSRMGREILWELAHNGIDAPALIESARALVEYDSRDRLAEIGVPTTITWGDRDHLVPVGGAYIYNRLIADSKLEIFDQTGHMVQMERPSRFNRLIEKFVDRHNG